MKAKKLKTIKKDAALASYDDKTLNALTMHVIKTMSLLAVGQKWSEQPSASLPLAATDITLLSQNLGTSPTSGTISALNLADQLAILGHYAVLSPYSLSSRGTTTANLAVTYANGTAGVGATLTATGNAALVVDGVTYNNGDYILVKDQSTALQNGFYIVTDKGSVSTPFILTRASTMNKPYECIDGRLIWVQQGTANFRTLYAMQVIQNVTIGTTPFNFWLAGANAIQLQGRNLASTAPTLNQVLAWNGGAWEPATASGSFPYVTVAATGADYTSVGAAINDNKYYILIIGACAETSDVNISNNGDYIIASAPNVSDDFGIYGMNVLNGTTANVRWEGGSILYEYASAKKFYNFTGSGTGTFTFDGVNFINTSSVDDCPVNGLPAFAGPTQNFVNCTFNLPDQSGCGIEVGAGIGFNLTFVSGGTNCWGALTASRGQFSAIKFKGAQWSSGAVASFGACTVNGVLVTSESGTPSVRINVTSACAIQGVYGEGSSSFVIILFSNTSITNFDVGPSGTIFLSSSSGYCAISNGTCVQNLISSNGAQAKFSNVHFTSSVGIESEGSLFSNCTFDGNNQIRANNVQMSCVSAGVPGGTGGNTFTLVSGVEGCSIIASNSEVSVVDLSGNTTNTLLANNLW